MDAIFKLGGILLAFCLIIHAVNSQYSRDCLLAFGKDFVAIVEVDLFPAFK